MRKCFELYGDRNCVEEEVESSPDPPSQEHFVWEGVGGLKAPGEPKSPGTVPR